MRSTSSWFLVRGLTVVSLLALSACVEGTTSSSTATARTEAAGTTAPAPTAPATPTTTVVLPPAPTATATATAPIPTPTPSTPPAAGLERLVGTWQSASCGDRTYPRHITFADATTFSAEDLVSPCPKGTACIWSGILNHQGSYKVEKDVIALKVEKASSGPKKVQFPASLTLDANRAPVESGSDGKPCPYRQAGITKPR